MIIHQKIIIDLNLARNARACECFQNRCFPKHFEQEQWVWFGFAHGMTKVYTRTFTLSLHKNLHKVCSRFEQSLHACSGYTNQKCNRYVWGPLGSVASCWVRTFTKGFSKSLWIIKILRFSFEDKVYTWFTHNVTHHVQDVQTLKKVYTQSAHTLCKPCAHCKHRRYFFTPSLPWAYQANRSEYFTKFATI